MKKSVYLLVISVFLLCAATAKVAAAEENTDSVYRNSITVFDPDEYEDVLQAIFTANLTKDRIMTRIQCGDGYKQYYLTCADFVAEIKEGKRLPELLSSDYHWMVPASNLEIQVTRNGGKWRPSGYGINDDPSMASYVRMDVLDHIISELTSDGNNDITEIYCFESPDYFTNFAYFATKEEEYLIPFGGRTDFSGLENGELYTVSQVCQALEINMPRTYNYSYNESMSVGDKLNRIGVTILVMGLLCVMAAVVFKGRSRKRCYK